MKRLALILCAVALFSGPAYAQHLSASGCSVSNVGYLNDLAKEYERVAGVKVLVRGGGSVVGLDDLQTGRVDFAASCRAMVAGDPEGIEFVQVAWDALVFITHPSNSMGDITIEQARAIYFGDINNWAQMGGESRSIKVIISRPKRGLSGVESSIRSMILGGREPTETPNTLFLASTGIVEQMVETTENGFATTGYSSARKRGVKMLRVKGVHPSRESIAKGKYPLKRPLYLVISKNPRPEARKFVDFALSRQGQQFIGSLGVVALKDVK